jgi:hypothetical protein
MREEETMKSLGLACAVAVLALGSAISAAAQETDMALMVGRGGCMTEELLRKLASCERCTKEQAAYLLGEARCPKAVLPLMAMLRDGEESARIVAALALCRIGDARGTFAVKRAATFDDSAKVRRLCAWYYDQYVEAGSFAFYAAEPPTPMLIGSR